MTQTVERRAVPMSAIRTMSDAKLEHLERGLRALRAELVRDGSASTRTLYWDAVARGGPQVAAFAYVMSGIPGASTAGAALLAITTVSVMGSWFHDQIHVPERSRTLLGLVMMRLGSAPVAASPRWWMYKHVRLHHLYPSDPRYDPDIQFGWFGRVTEGQPWRPTHRTQAVHMWLLMPFATLSMAKPAEVWQSRRFRTETGVGPAHSVQQIMIDKYVPALAVWLPVFLSQGVSFGMVALVTFNLTAGLSISIITQVQHNTMLTLDQDPRLREHPITAQIFSASDVGSEHGIWWWLCGGVNYHSLHHAAPTLSFRRLPDGTRRMRDYLATHEVEPPVHRNIWSAVRSHAALVQHLATAPTARGGDE